MNISSYSADKTKYILKFDDDLQNSVFYLYDTRTHQGTRLFQARPALAKYTLAPMCPVSFTSRDGLKIHGYLTLPAGIPAQNLPLILLVHGGPHSRDSWGFNATVQWLANRGYAVLQVNYRGSRGYGKAFERAGDREWGRAMHHDLLDAVDWAVKKGFADPARVAIFGGSYGGYAALVGATFTPDTFSCAVSLCGPSSLITLLESLPPYWDIAKADFYTRVGNSTETEFLKSRSPLYAVNAIKKPLLIVQGARDPRVKKHEAEQFVTALKAKNIPYEYILFEDEGHGLRKPHNRIRFYTALESFLEKHLGGRKEV